MGVGLRPGRGSLPRAPGPLLGAAALPRGSLRSSLASAGSRFVSLGLTLSITRLQAKHCQSSRDFASLLSAATLSSVHRLWCHLAHIEHLTESLLTSLSHTPQGQVGAAAAAACAGLGVHVALPAAHLAHVHASPLRVRRWNSGRRSPEQRRWYLVPQCSQLIAPPPTLVRQRPHLLGVYGVTGPGFVSTSPARSISRT